MLSASQLLLLAGVGVVAGLVLLVRGMLGYQAAARISDTATSTITSLAIGDVRVSGTVEPGELALVSPLRSTPCVYYRSRVLERANRSTRTILREERAVGFRVRDATGTVRVFPRDARFDVPARYHEGTGLMGEQPPGLRFRVGAAVSLAQPSREEQVAALLTVHRPEDGDGMFESLVGNTLMAPIQGRRDFEEAWIELGDTVTIVGQVLTFDQLPDPDTADEGGRSGDIEMADPEIAADMAAARAAGTLAADPAAAWGNAAIPGFGIGHPTRAPELDPAARPEPVATEAEEKQMTRTFDLAPDTLILASSRDAPLLIAFGAPVAATDRQQARFLVGLLGAILAIASAMVAAAVVSGFVA
jgi:hypothetical protein